MLYYEVNLVTELGSSITLMTFSFIFSYQPAIFEEVYEGGIYKAILAEVCYYQHSLASEMNQ